MAEYKRGSHIHFVWITKYGYKVIKGQVAVRLRELLKQGNKEVYRESRETRRK